MSPAATLKDLAKNFYAEKKSIQLLILGLIFSLSSIAVDYKITDLADVCRSSQQI